MMRRLDLASDSFPLHVSSVKEIALDSEHLTDEISPSDTGLLSAMAVEASLCSSGKRLGLT
jgi:hypothetical protein